LENRNKNPRATICRRKNVQRTDIIDIRLQTESWTAFRRGRLRVRFYKRKRNVIILTAPGGHRRCLKKKTKQKTANNERYQLFVLSLRVPSRVMIRARRPVNRTGFRLIFRGGDRAVSPAATGSLPRCRPSRPNPIVRIVFAARREDMAKKKKNTKPTTGFLENIYYVFFRITRVHGRRV